MAKSFTKPELTTVKVPPGTKIVQAEPIPDKKYKLLSEDQQKIMKGHVATIDSLGKRIESLEIENNSLHNELHAALEEESISPIDKKLSAAIVADLAARVGTAIVDHVATDVMENFKFIPAARNMTIRFVAKEMLWTDPDSMQQLIIDEWKKHVAKHLQCRVENIEEHLRISLVIPQLSASSRINKKKKEPPILDLDEDVEV